VKEKYSIDKQENLKPRLSQEKTHENSTVLIESSSDCMGKKTFNS